MKNLFGDKVIMSIHDATEYFKNKLIEIGLTPTRILEENYKRHRLIIAYQEYKHLYSKEVVRKYYRFWLIYQEDWFLSFAKYFDVVDVAATINLNILSKILKQKDENRIHKLVFCNRDGALLWINPFKMYRVAKKNNWIRVTEKTGEVVVHYPVSWLMPVSIETLNKD